MAFNTQLRIENGDHRGEWKLYDIGGLWDAVSNPDGWGNGTTNPRTNQVTAARLNLYFPDDSQEIGIDIFSATVPFPNTTEVPTFLISDEDLATSRTVFPDGKYNFDYIVDGEWDPQGAPEAFESIYEGVFFNTANAQCCVDELFSRVDPVADPCKDENWEKFIYGSRLYRGLVAAVSCKNWNKADVILSRLQEFCNTNKINCGC